MPRLASLALVAGAGLALASCTTTAQLEADLSRGLTSRFAGAPLSDFILWRNASPVDAFDVAGARAFRFGHPCASIVMARRAGPGATPAAWTIESVRITGVCLAP